jgi:serine protease AprX
VQGHRRTPAWKPLQLAALSAAVLAATSVAGSATAASASARTAAASSGSSAVIVVATPGHEAAVQARAAELGLTVGRSLGIIHGFAARGSVTAVARLKTLPDVVSVSPDASMKPLSVVPSLGYDPADAGSSSSFTQLVGAQAAWAAGYTGTGVDVAVIDTGVSPVPTLSGTNKVITGPDLSFDSVGATIPGLDGFGHGTFMASLIAGRDATATASATGCTTCLNASGYSDTTKYVGVAPDARIINVKVGAADGATDVSQVIAAIDWVSQHAHDTGFNIKVLNLSFGTNSTQAYTVDPLAQAAEAAWKRGIVVVVAGGNDGSAVTNLADPAYDPYLIAVGGLDTKNTLATSDDVVASFANHGTAARPVDVVAPATHILGARVTGSFVDTLSTNTGQVGTQFQRGSGTSEAAAEVSGVAALLVQKYPTATPDTIKALIKANAAWYGKPTPTAVTRGNGLVNAGKALSAVLSVSVQTATASTGTGSLDAARGGVYVSDNGVNLTGQVDIFGQPFNSAAMAAAQTNGTAWSGGVWNGSRWTGDSWTGSRWTASSWTGNSWAGSRWTGSRWTGMAWDGSRWTGTGWSGSRWTGSTWSGSRWSGSTWS